MLQNNLSEVNNLFVGENNMESNEVAYSSVARIWRQPSCTMGKDEIV